MKISVIGTGYVGLPLACFADFGHEVIFIGRNQEKVNLMNGGVPPIYESGLEEILKRNAAIRKIIASTDYKLIDSSDIIFICVATPSKEDGSIDISDIKMASVQIGKRLKETKKYVVVVVKSTVVPRTTLNNIIPILEEYSGKVAGKDFGVCMNPEFLREGTAIEDFLNPDKIVLGCLDDKSYSILEKIYEPFNKNIPRIKTDLNTAEMIKYAQNAALALRISFINEIANICEKYSIDVNEVAHAIGIDRRIGPKFLNAGIGFGGSCFPKDVKALVAASRFVSIEPILLKAILEVNEKQPYRMIKLAEETIGNLTNKTVAVLGLAFKPDTDDVRDACSIPIIKSLIERGVKVKVYDPKAMKNAEKTLKDTVQYCSSKEDCIKDADLCMIVTEWEEFANIDCSIIKCPIIDGRRIIDITKIKEHNLIYKGIGWKKNYG